MAGFGCEGVGNDALVAKRKGRTANSPIELAGSVLRGHRQAVPSYFDCLAVRKLAGNWTPSDGNPDERRAFLDAHSKLPATRRIVMSMMLAHERERFALADRTQ